MRLTLTDHFAHFHLPGLLYRYRGLLKTRQVGQEKKIHDSYQPSMCKNQNPLQQRENGVQCIIYHSVGCTLTSLISAFMHLHFFPRFVPGCIKQPSVVATVKRDSKLFISLTETFRALSWPLT